METNMIIDSSYVETMRGEVLREYIKLFLVLLAVCAIIFLVIVLICIIQSKRISLCNLIFVILVIFSVFFIIRNYCIINNSFKHSFQHNNIQYSFLIDNSSLKIDSLCEDVNHTIRGEEIERIVYKDHVILIIAIDNYLHMIPNFGNIDFLIEKQ